MKEFNHWRERQEHQQEIHRKNLQDKLILLISIIGLGVVIWTNL